MEGRAGGATADHGIWPERAVVHCNTEVDESMNISIARFVRPRSGRSGVQEGLGLADGLVCPVLFVFALALRIESLPCCLNLAHLAI